VRRRIREVVRDLGGERKQNEELKETVERLENEARDLRARVAKIEASNKPAPKKSAAPASPTRKKSVSITRSKKKK
jgi:hypothetical protein